MILLLEGIGKERDGEKRRDGEERVEERKGENRGGEENGEEGWVGGWIEGNRKGKAGVGRERQGHGLPSSIHILCR